MWRPWVTSTGEKRFMLSEDGERLLTCSEQFGEKSLDLNNRLTLLSKSI